MMPRRAWSGLLSCALVGMVWSCSTPMPVRLSADDRALDRLWLELSRGNVGAAEAAAAEVGDEQFHRRALADVEAARLGRAQVLSELVADDELPADWLVARYLASSRRARSRLRAARSHEGRHAALMLEEARRSGSIDRREAIAGSARARSPGGAEGLALLVESFVAQRRYAEAARLLEDAPDSARLRLATRQLDAYTGRLMHAADGLLEDMAAGLAVPTSVALLEQILDVVPMGRQERRAVELLAAGDTATPSDLLQWQAERQLQARLLARAGHLEEALQVARPDGRDGGAEARRIDRWQWRADGAPPVDAAPLEARVDKAPERVSSDDLLTLRLAHEWRLAARGTYERVALTGSATDLVTFLDTLDEAAEPLAPDFRLADVPRIDYGVFGEMLDTQALRRHLPRSFVVGGKGLGMPPELTWYDLVSATDEQLPEPPGGTYEECHVVNLRVPGYAASRGARFAGAGLDRFVFLDLDQVARDAGVARLLSAEPLPAWPAAGSRQRRDLSEPLETAARLSEAARAAAGADYEDRVLEALSIHERRHIIDVREFFGGGVFSQISDVISAGLLPGAVRAEVERRAQLDALRVATDPRIPLAHAISYLPVQGASAGSEHARGYEELVADFLAVLDEESWEGSQPLETYGLRRDRVLIQQVHLLPPEVIRDIAWSVEL